MYNDNTNAESVDDKSVLPNDIRGYIANAKQNKDEDDISFWKRSEQFYPRLAQVARLDFLALATSKNLKRLFNIAGLICSKRQSRLSGFLRQRETKDTMDW